VIPRRIKDDFRVNNCLKSLELEDNQFKIILDKIRI